MYAQFRNCIDLAVAAAFIRNQDYYGLVNWKPTVFYDESAYPVETLNPPKQVESAVNSMWKGTMLVTPIGGGVQMRPTEAINPTNLLEDSSKRSPRPAQRTIYRNSRLINGGGTDRQARFTVPPRGNFRRDLSARSADIRSAPVRRRGRNWRRTAAGPRPRKSRRSSSRRRPAERRERTARPAAALEIARPIADAPARSHVVAA